MSVFSRIKVWAYKEQLASADLNAEFDNIINNMTPTGIEDVSANVSGMQAAVDPGGVGSESLATTMAAEIYRIRFILRFLLGKTQWYDHTGRSLAAGALALQTADYADATVTTVKIVDANITNSKLAPLVVTNDKLALPNLAVTASCGIFNTSSTTFTPVTNLSVSGFITTGSRPVVAELIWDGSLNGGSVNLPLSPMAGSDGSSAFGLFRNGTLVAVSGVIGSSQSLSAGALRFIDQSVPAATNTYVLQAKTNSGTGTSLSYCKMVIREL